MTNLHHQPVQTLLKSYPVRLMDCVDPACYTERRQWRQMYMLSAAFIIWCVLRFTDMASIADSAVKKPYQRYYSYRSFLQNYTVPLPC